MRLGPFAVAASAAFVVTSRAMAQENVLPDQRPAQSAVKQTGKVVVEITKDAGGTRTLKPLEGLTGAASALELRSQDITLIVVWKKSVGLKPSDIHLSVNAADSSTALRHSVDTSASWSSSHSSASDSVGISLFVASDQRVSFFWKPESQPPPALACGPMAAAAVVRADSLNADTRIWFQSFRRMRPTALVVDTYGRVLAEPSEGTREDQQIEVTVVGADATKYLVARTSATRAIQGPQIAGEPVANTASKGGSGDEAPEGGPCIVRQVLGNFASGEGKVALRAVPSTAGQAATDVATLAFPVRRTVHGQISVGLAKTSVIDPQFSLVHIAGKSNGRDTTFTALRDASDSSARLVPVVFLTAFLPGPLDLDGATGHRDFGWWLSPTVGFNPQRLGDDWFAGGSIHVARILLIHGGVHFGRGKTLRDPVANVAAPYTGDPTSLPLQTTTRRSGFLAISVDGVAASVWLSDTVKALFKGWSSSSPSSLRVFGVRERLRS